MEPYYKHVSFQSFCELCEKVKNAKDPKKKYDLVKSYFTSYQDEASSKKMDKNLFPILRLLLPQEDRVRNAYGLKEFALAKIYIRVLSLPKDGHEAKKLLNYKSPTASQSTVADFADVAFWVLKSRCREQGTCSIADIENALDKIANFNAENKPRAIDDELTKLVSNTTAMQQKWIIRLILKDIKLGLGKGKILNCFHPDAVELLESTNNLQEVCLTLHSPSIKLNEIEIKLFTPFRPMLSDRLDISKISGVFKAEVEYFIECKFDGERFQVHMKDNCFKYFSRNSHNYTDNYGSDFSNGILTPKLKNCFNSDVKSFILDGEMMGWHKTKKVFSSKGVQFDVKKITENSHYQPCFCVFDILFLNDKILTNVPLKERLVFLDNLFEDQEGVILKSKRKITSSISEVLDSLNEAIDNQDEGIIIKQTDSLYKPNSRKSGWFKIKPEYTQGAMNELDLLIIGGYYSENKRYGLISSVMLGAAVTEDGKPKEFHSVGRVKLSLAAEEVEELCSKLEPHWNVVNKANDCPEGLQWTKDKPDLWIKPQDSFILQIKATELVKTSVFKTSYTLRFPRIEKVRFDKPWYDCLTVAEFQNLVSSETNVEKLTAGRIHRNQIDDDQSVSPRKRAKVLKVHRSFQEAIKSEPSRISSLLDGKEICVLTGNEQISKQDLEAKIIENGGKVTQHPGPTTFCIVAGDKNFRVNSAVNAGIYCIATVDWLLNSLREENICSGNVCNWTPMYLLGKSKEILEKFALLYDKYDDSYTEDATLESLKHSLSKCDEYIEPLTTVEMEYIDRLLFNGPSPYSFLRSCVVYFIKNEDKNDDLEWLKMDFKFYGGKIVPDETDLHLVSQVIVADQSKIDEIAIVKDILKFSLRKPDFVTLDWLIRCLGVKKMISVDGFLI